MIPTLPIYVPDVTFTLCPFLNLFVKCSKGYYST